MPGSFSFWGLDLRNTGGGCGRLCSTFGQVNVVGEKRITFAGHAPGLKIGGGEGIEESRAPRIFLLSPANAAGIRAKRLFHPEARFELAQRLRGAGASLGEVFSFISGLYFRGKLAYAERFADPPAGVEGVHVITAAGGLLTPAEIMTLPRLRAISAAQVDAENPEYREPLDRDVRRLRAELAPGTQVVLLGSIATPKYVEPLLEVFGEALLFPKEFVGRGDMSRGGLLLRCSAAGEPLAYTAVFNAVRSGPRPAKLSRMKAPRKTEKTQKK